ncbi:nucleotidyl transferase AbiEii/AbiGii toxin family protein [Methylibium sp.]|uniref:nucleotidyl transferase AbiEii/AbiGii toxin family protein n=1 Tax=Methylibium sp. TaxID=2067992 RepID=UPI00286A18CF|nr:nucleotidyl transferase AbiEii/AbiGii toxin family protein [Methylibium sp.]
MARLASQFVALPPERRELAFTQTAARMAVSSVMVEKDFWVSWLLGLLFADPALAPHLVFKGGTSLSKVYGVIDRFSEDIDLSMSPAFVGADESVFAALKSRTRRDAALAQMQAQCGEQTRNVLMPRLEQAIVEHLGRRPRGASWLRYQDDAVARSTVVHFEYPTASEAGFEYLRREVKLELGSLTDQRPTEQHAVRPWVVDDFPAAFPDWQCQVTALELARTFWEKATILHAEHHRPADQATPDRYARHYADMERLLRHPDATAMLADHALCERVVEWKSRVFARQWARYDLARPGTFRLVPTEERLTALARDYAQMLAMFIAAPPEFGVVMARLAEAERTLNASGAS